MLPAMKGDILNTICTFMDNVKSLGLLCKTHKVFNEYLHSKEGGIHWLRIAKNICGPQYWHPISQIQPRWNDGAYMAMIRICPWLAYQFETFNNGVEFGIKNSDFMYDVKKIHLNPKFSNNAIIEMSPLVDDPKRPPIFVQSQARPFVPIQNSLVRGYQPYPETTSVVHAEEQILRNIKNKKWFVPSKLFNISRTKVVKIHNELLAIIAEHKPFAYPNNIGSISVCFYSLKTKTLMCHKMLDAISKDSVYFGCGEWWAMTSSALQYFGPAYTPDQIKTVNILPGRISMACWLASAGHAFPAVEFIKQKHYNPSIASNGMGLLFYAILSDNPACIDEVLKTIRAHTRQEEFNDNPVAFAAMHGCKKALRFLHLNGWCMNPVVNNSGKTDEEGDLLLSTLASTPSPNLKIIKLLLHLKADVSAKDSRGRTPLYMAYSAEIVDLFCSAGADVSARDNDGCTAFMELCTYPFDTIQTALEKLVYYGYNINAQDFDQNTALHKVADFFYLDDSIQRIEFLIDLGIDINICNTSGKTALSQFILNNEEIVDTEKYQIIFKLLSGEQ